MKFYKSNLIQYIIIVVQNKTITPEFIYRYESNTNTKVYIPMTTDLIDHGPNSITINNNYSVALTSLSGVKFNVADFHNTSQRYLSFTNVDNMSGAWTISVRARIDTGRLEDQWLFTQGTGSTNRGLHLGYSTGTRGLVFGMYSNDADTDNSQWQDNTWHNYIFTWNGSTGYNIIVDGVSVKSGTLSSGFQSGNNTGYIGQQSFSTAQSSVVFKGYMSEFFIETGQRTVAQALTYVNKTKKNYGIA